MLNFTLNWDFDFLSDFRLFAAEREYELFFYRAVINPI